MKILQNPIAVGVLAVFAVALMFKQIAWPFVQRSHWMQHSSAPVPVVAAAPAAPASPAPAPTNPIPQTGAITSALPVLKIDAYAAAASAGRGVEPTSRDPFQGELLATSQAKTYPPAWQLLTFNGLWHQSGNVSVAVINNQIVAPGESILAYRLQSIERDRVWVVGPNGREAVGFGAVNAAPIPQPTPYPAPAQPKQ